MLKLFCNHDFEIIKTLEKESTLEKLLKAGLEMWQRGIPDEKHLVIYKCRKCGKIRESRF